tara:strand:- start:729 stop:962 length:234 start_codon:yes stop_codon:yes gene_type:complete
MNNKIVLLKEDRSIVSCPFCGTNIELKKDAKKLILNMTCMDEHCMGKNKIGSTIANNDDFEAALVNIGFKQGSYEHL